MREKRSEKWKLTKVKHGRKAETARRFASTGSHNSRERLLERQEYETNPTSRLRAGRMAIELAQTEPDPIKKLQYIERAQATLEHIVALGTVRYLPTTGQAEVMLANLHNYQSLVLNGSVAAARIRQVEYEKLVEIGERQIVQARDMQKSSREHGYYIGLIGEISVLLLTQRFGLQSPENAWTGIPAHISNDMARHDGDNKRKAWDVSVFTQYDENPADLTYKIQVKAGKDGATDYAGDVAIVRVNRDLVIESPECLEEYRHMPLGAIIHEAALELESQGSTPTQRLDQRTELLLDILG